MAAHYRAQCREFLRADPAAILGHLLGGWEGSGSQALTASQKWAWEVSVHVLQRCCRAIADIPDGHRSCSILLEYAIPRRGKQVDAVLLLDDVVVVIEFKVGATSFARDALRQVEDYALNLRDFHKESAGRVLLPVLCATKAPRSSEHWEVRADAAVQPVLLVNRDTAATAIVRACSICHRSDAEVIPMEAWNVSPYEPVPTIIEAAQALYAGHDVQEICRSHAGAFNLSTTTRRVLEILGDARARKQKVACFITGVPGAGKTLAGLNIVHSPRTARHDLGLGAFLSGNGPLVQVLTEALARDKKLREGDTLVAARHEVETFIHNVHRFVQHYHDDNPLDVPVDHVIVFDEAQRAWDADKVRRHSRGKREGSEPSMLIGAMDRREDWAGVVALVGSGQEIHDGEAGLAEWGHVIREEFPHWSIWASPEAVSGGASTGGRGLFEEGGPGAVQVHADEALHLGVSLRAYRAAAASAWADAVVDGDVTGAQKAMRGMGLFPVALTRDLDAARRWLRMQARGTRRCGLVACSGAKRLRPWGVEVNADFDAAMWFLASPEDVRSSYYLELVATEFGIQGLELDWVGVCWGADLAREGDVWKHRRFRGTKWEDIRGDVKRQFLRNKYRVLLTRAREGIVIWVPPGDVSDPTRHPASYDATADYLQACGANPIVLPVDAHRAS